MTLESPSPEKSLSIEAQERIAEELIRFSRALKNGKNPTIEAYLEGFTGAERAELLQELLSDELHFRKQIGENPLRSEYAARFPEEEEVLNSVLCPENLNDTNSERVDSNLAPTVVLDGITFTETTSTILGRFGDYELLGELGRGGMGIVYKAKQKSADRLVALKVIGFALAGENGSHSQAAIERFRVEAKAAARIQHKNLVTVYDVGEINGQPYYSMQYVVGETLQQLVQKGPVGNRRAAEIMFEIAQGVQAAHEEGILHRDLKPENILIDAKHNRPLVTDFGLAKLSEDGPTMIGEVFGTIQYMSPEQATDAGSVTPKSDLYSLGATFYYLLVGKPPFRGSSPLEILEQVHKQNPIPPRELNKEISKDLETICLKCLEKAPNQRLNSVQELVEELKRYLAGEPIVSRPPSAIELLGRWCRKNQKVLIGATLLCLATFLGTRVSGLYPSQVPSANAPELPASQAPSANAPELSASQAPNRSKFNLQLSRVLAELDHDPEQAIALLEDSTSCPEELRDFSWRLLHYSAELGLNAPYSIPLDAAIPITSVAIDPLGARFCTAGWDGKVSVWSFDTREKISDFSGHTNWVTSVGFSPDGELIVTAGWDGCVRIWNAKTLRPWVVQSKSPASQIDSPVESLKPLRARFDDDRLGFNNPAQIREFEVKNGMEWGKWKFHRSRVRAAVFSPAKQRRMLATLGADNQIHLLNLEDLTQTSYPLPPGRKTQFDPRTDVGKLCFSPDGEFLCCGTESGLIHLIHLKTGWEKELVGHNAGVTGLAFSPDGKKLASGHRDHKIGLWDLEDVDRIRMRDEQGPAISLPMQVLEGHKHAIYPVVFSPDSETLVSGSADKTIRLWDGKTGEFRSILPGHQDQVWALAFSPGGETLVTGGWDKTVRFWPTHSLD